MFGGSDFSSALSNNFVYDPATDRMALTSYAAAGDGSQLASLPYLMAAVADYKQRHGEAAVVEGDQQHA